MTTCDSSYIEYKGVKINTIDFNSILLSIDRLLNSNGTGYICMNDVRNIVFASEDNDMKKAVNNSYLSIADGMPLVWYGRLSGCRSIERVAGFNLMRRLFSENNGYKHYLLGDTEKIQSKVMQKALELNKKINITGHSPPFKEFDEVDNKDILERINREKPDIIWVSFGGGKQEKWMNQNVANLDRGVLVGVGAAFRFFIGDIITPPQIIQNLGLQWLFRMGQEFVKHPRKTIKVMSEKKLIISKVVFIANVMSEVIAARKHLKRAKD